MAVTREGGGAPERVRPKELGHGIKDGLAFRHGSLRTKKERKGPSQEKNKRKNRKNPNRRGTTGSFRLKNGPKRVPRLPTRAIPQLSGYFGP